MRAITMEREWANMYQRLLPRLAIYDERTKDYRGKMKAIGRIAGQMTSMIFALFKTDQELLSHVPFGQDPLLLCSMTQQAIAPSRRALPLIEARNTTTYHHATTEAAVNLRHFG